MYAIVTESYATFGGGVSRQRGEVILITPKEEKAHLEPITKVKRKQTGKLRAFLEGHESR